MAAVTATVAAGAEATGLAVLIAADAAVAVIAVDVGVSRAVIAVDVAATVAHVETAVPAAVAADLAGGSVVSTANADQAHHLDRFRT